MNIYSKIVIFSCFAFSAFAYAEQKPIPGCEGMSPPQARSCLSQMMSESEKAMVDMEYKSMDALRRWNEASSISTQVQSRLVATAKTFRIYRNAECGLVANLGSMSQQLEMENDQISCIYELNIARTSHLSLIFKDLPQR